MLILLVDGDGNHDSTESVLSRTCFVIMYDGCPITLGSKLQTGIALFTTESDYIALSSAIREVIPFLGHMKETSGLFGLLTRDPVFRCNIWEDNEICITVAKSPKFTSWKNHISIKLSSSIPLIRLIKFQISSPSPWERRVSVSCGISLWVSDSIGFPIESDVNAM